ncbi:major royal jelly protein 1-like [Neodiprion fabricii]|uniref:major royal jelly protein 1-like n=1 Tax=Neodiprion fabricii TaxID=2872261 RepID=UPI001ED91027|nr:major royal jelly protein 1-like [Neodiprion fabricii]
MTSFFRINWLLPIILACTGLSATELDVIYEWKYVDYVWQSTDQKQDAIEQGVYNLSRILMFDQQPLPDGRRMVTTPKFYNNPATLSTISDATGDGGPLLAPYPDWSWHNKSSGDCSGITSVNRAVIDDCGRIWIVDSGTIGNELICPAKILAFNSTTDELLESFEFSSDLLRGPWNNDTGILEIQVVECSANACDDYWVYIGDVSSYGLVIFNGEKAWRLDDEIFLPSEAGSQFSIAGENFTMGIGPSGFLLTRDGYMKEKYLMFKALSAFKTYAASLEDMHNTQYSGSNVTYYVSNWTASSHEVGKVFTIYGGIVITGFTDETELVCWNLQNPLDNDYVAVLEQNETTLQYISSVKPIIEDGSDIETVWVLTNRFQKYVLGTMNFDEINFRMITAEVAALVKDTVCEPEDHEVLDSILDINFLYLKTVSV